MKAEISPRPIELEMHANDKGLLNFSIRDLIWLITIVAIVCGVWMHGKHKERVALERERAAREELATTQLLVQQLEADSAQQAAYAKRDLARAKQELESALKTNQVLTSELEQLKLQEQLHDSSKQD